MHTSGRATMLRSWLTVVLLPNPHNTRRTVGPCSATAQRSGLRRRGCACCAADGCKVSVHLWETWTLLRLIHACTGLLKPCVSAKSCSAIVLKKWPQPATMPCFRGAVDRIAMAPGPVPTQDVALQYSSTLQLFRVCENEHAGKPQHLMHISMQYLSQ